MIQFILKPKEGTVGGDGSVVSYCVAIQKSAGVTQTAEEIPLKLVFIL